MTQKILVVEDEPTLSRLLSYNLSQEGYEVQIVEDGALGLQTALHGQFDLIMLDIMLPGLDGFEILTKIRQKSIATPVIILTARNAENEVVHGLKLGADDYITKPFGVAELLARVSAVLRRTQADGALKTSSVTSDRSISFGEIQVFPDKYEVIVNDDLISLRPKEFEVLLYLVQRPGIVVTRDDLMNVVWGFDYFGGQRTVDVHVSSLRKKLELGQDTVQIDSIRGVGYKLVMNRKKK